MKRTSLRSKDVVELIAPYGVSVSKKDMVELLEDKHKIILINKDPAFVYYEEKLVPALKYLQTHEILKKIAIDVGAIKFVVNGADVMRPGIIFIDPEIKKDEVIVVIDGIHKKALAVGIALFSGSEMQAMNTGKVIKNVHWVGDEIWQMN